MKIEITNEPDSDEFNVIATGLRNYNSKFSSGTFEHLTVYVRDEKHVTVGGLIGVTFGGWLHIEIIWVSEELRGNSIGSELLAAAEREAISRGCTNSTLDTYSFQALEFYLKLGYTQFGSLQGYAGKYERHYLQKRLSN